MKRPKLKAEENYVVDADSPTRALKIFKNKSNEFKLLNLKPALD